MHCYGSYTIEETEHEIRENNRISYEGLIEDGLPVPQTSKYRSVYDIEIRCLGCYLLLENF